MSMLNWCGSARKRIVLCLNPTMANANLGFRVYDWHHANWQLLGNNVLISDRACITGLDQGMRAEVATVVGTDNVFLLADSTTNRVIGRLDFMANGSLTIWGDMNSAVENIPDRMPMIYKHKVAGVLAVNGLINITIVDLVNGYDEDILRYKHADKGVFVPNKYMVPTPTVDLNDRGLLPLAPESQKKAKKPATESVASTSRPTADEQVHIAVANPIPVEPIEIVSGKELVPVEIKNAQEIAAVEPTQKSAKTEPSFDEWAETDVPPALRPSTGQAKSSSTEPSDSDE